MTLSVVQTFHGFTEGEMFYPHLFLIFFITDLVHDIEGVAAVGVDRVIERDRRRNGVHGRVHGLERQLQPSGHLLERRLARLLSLHGLAALQHAVGRVAHRAADANGAVVAQIPPDLTDDHRHAVGGKTNILRSVEVVDGL